MGFQVDGDEVIMDLWLMKLDQYMIWWLIAIDDNKKWWPIYLEMLINN